MTLSPLLETSTELLLRAREHGGRLPGLRGWEELLSWLVMRTQALGGEIVFRPGHPAAAARPSAAPASPLIVGDFGDACREEVAAWLIDQPGRECHGPVHDGASQKLFGCPLPDGNGHAAGYLALAFPADRELLPDHCAVLASAVSALTLIVEQEAGLRSFRHQIDRFQHLYEVGQGITSTLDFEQVLRQSTARVAEVLDAEASTLMLVDETRGELVFEIPAGPAGHILEEKRMPIGKGVAGWVASRGEPLIIPDVERDARFYVAIDRMTGYRTRSILAVPLRIKGKITGVVEVINKLGGDAFSADDLLWLSTLAPLIAVAIENARLFAEERQLSRALREERDRFITAEEKVRHELARNLHDGPAQIMAALILNIDMARRQLVSRPEKMATELNFLESLAQEANQEVRDLLFSLRPLSLEAHGLVAALRQLVERIQFHASYQIHLEVPEPPCAIEPRVAGTLFVIVQEALNNIQKHARAGNVWVTLGASDRNLWIEVNDDGIGFDVVQVDARYTQLNSFGLLNMRERARLIDGVTRIESPRPGHENGTLVCVEVPLWRACPGMSSE